MTNNGLEWLYRFTVQPGYTWRRYLPQATHFFYPAFSLALTQEISPWADSIDSPIINMITCLPKGV